jgi:hypothetical protein
LRAKKLNQDVCSSMMKRQQLEKERGIHTILTDEEIERFYVGGVFLSPSYQSPYHPCYNTVSLLRQGVHTVSTSIGTFWHCRAKERMHTVVYHSISDGISITNKSWRTIRCMLTATMRSLKPGEDDRSE